MGKPILRKTTSIDLKVEINVQVGGRQGKTEAFLSHLIIKH
jgi:hypothetical protein